MQNLKKFYQLLKFNFWTLIAFESSFKLASFFIFTPLFLKIFDFVLHLTGFQYLTLENIFQFIFNPLTLLTLVILLFCILAYTIFDIIAIIIILDASASQKTIKLFEVFRLTAKRYTTIIRPGNLALAFFVLFLIPFLNFGIASSFISSIKIPEFILDFIFQTPLLLTLLCLFITGLVILLARWLYALHYFVLYNLSFNQSRRQSLILGKHHHLKDILILLGLQFAIFLIFFAVVMLGIFIIISLDKIFDNLILKSILISIIGLFLMISILIFSVLSVPISYAGISVLFYHHQQELQQPPRHLHFSSAPLEPHLQHLLKLSLSSLVLLAIIGGSVLNYHLYRGDYNFNIEYLRTLEITAHRGASLNYPENTMLAFTAAKAEGANWIELDVQQTSDGKLVVLHDHNLVRTTGMRQNIWQTTYTDLQNLDAGSFLSPEFKDARIPLLEEVISWAKRNTIKLNIELKPHGHETNLEQSVTNLIQTTNFTNSCVVSSQYYHVLENLKNLNPNLQTVYVMSIAYGDLYTLPAADSFSIEARNITPRLVNSLHDHGKDIYAWTVNSSENIQRMIDLGVDNIITDDVPLAKQLVFASKNSNFINEYIKFINNLF